MNVPNQLGDKETKHSLQCWEAKVRTFMTKDKRFSLFLPGGDDRAWNTAAAHYNLNDDDGLLYVDTYPIQYLQLHRNPKKRTRAQKITDLDQFIQTIPRREV